MSARGFRLWPQSLYGQILLVVALALLLAQAFNAFMLLSGARVRAVVEASTIVVSRVSSQVERSREFGIPIDHGTVKRNSGERPSRFRGSNVSIIVRDAPLNIASFEEQREMTERANEFLAQANVGLVETHLSLGPITALPEHLRHNLLRKRPATRMPSPQADVPRQAVLLSGRLENGRWVVAAAKVRPSDSGSKWALLLQTLTLYIAVMIPLALVARRIARPLERLKQSVQRVGLAGNIEPLESRGPGDVRQLIDAFNAMQARVSSLLAEKDVMLGAIGHDLKTPLAALRVRVESVEDDHEREKMAGTIDEMVTILDDILTLARLGKSGEAMQRTDLDLLLGSLAEEFEDAGTPVSLAEKEARHVGNVRPVLLRRALRNLIGNALTYGGAAEIHLDQVGNWIRIHIDDNGPGIPEDQIAHMFEPFARTGTHRNRATGGSGLGLTIARAIARSHGGEVELLNRAEGGLRATLTLPQD